MKLGKSKTFILGVLAILGLSVAVQATPSVILLGDTGTWRVTGYDVSNQINGIGSATLPNPYGAPPFPAVTTVTPNTVWSIIFTPTADFFSSASNGSLGTAGKTSVMEGKLDFYITLDTPNPVKLTTNVYENGIWDTTGNGTRDVKGGVVVTGVTVVGNNYNEGEVRSDNSGFLSESYTPSGWSLFNQVQGSSFTNSYFTYKISIDNALIAESLSSPGAPGSAYIAKKDFRIVLTTDGSSGSGAPAPEPASLGVLALGGLALLARRRRA